MDLYEGLKLKQIRPVPIDSTHIFDMVGMEFEILKLNPNTVQLQGHDVTMEVMDDLLEEYFQPLDRQKQGRFRVFEGHLDLDEVLDEVIFLYEEYGKKIEDNLTLDAIELKHRILEFIKAIKNLDSK